MRLLYEVHEYSKQDRGTLAEQTIFLFESATLQSISNATFSHLAFHHYSLFWNNLSSLAISRDIRNMRKTLFSQLKKQNPLGESISGTS
jgi:hypothetical protein